MRMIQTGILLSIVAACKTTNTSQVSQNSSENNKADNRIDDGIIFAKSDEERSDMKKVISQAFIIAEGNRQRSGTARRDTHSKTHGCLRGELKLNDNLPNVLKNDFFIDGARYPIVARFSNGATGFNPDRAPDARAMAIKVKLNKPQKSGLPTVSSETQSLLDPSKIKFENPKRLTTTLDFITNNYPVFFLSTIKSFGQFQADLIAGARAGDPQSAIRNYFVNGNPENGVPKAVANKEGAIFQKLSSVADGLLNQDYYSGSVFKANKKVLFKYGFAACQDNKLNLASEEQIASEDSYLSQNLETNISNHSQCLEMFVQLAKADSLSESDPLVNLPTELWSNADYPRLVIGKVVFPKQVLDQTVTRQACENLSFTIWRGDYDQIEPVGELNRLRRYAYPAIHQWRMKANNQPIPEEGSVFFQP